MYYKRVWFVFTFLFIKTIFIRFLGCFIFALYFDAHIMAFYGFADGASWHTRNLASVAWVIYSPSDELIISGGRCLGPATNNITEYQAAIGLMTESLSSGILQLIANLDSQLVVSQLNGIFSIRDPTLLRLFRRVCLLERSFTYIHFCYIPRWFNTVADSLANFMLEWYLSH